MALSPCCHIRSHAPRAPGHAPSFEICPTAGLIGFEMSHKTYGVIGTGNIGIEVGAAL